TEHVADHYAGCIRHHVNAKSVERFFLRRAVTKRSGVFKGTGRTGHSPQMADRKWEAINDAQLAQIGIEQKEQVSSHLLNRHAQPRQTPSVACPIAEARKEMAIILVDIIPPGQT